MVCLEERKTAAEYFRRQQLLDVERRTLRFQASWGYCEWIRANRNFTPNMIGRGNSGKIIKDPLF